MRFGHRIDKNQPAIVKAFRQLGCSVAITSKLGQGFPDLVVGKSGRTVLVEVKDGSSALTAHEQAFRDDWRGFYTIVRDLHDVARVVHIMNGNG